VNPKVPGPIHALRRLESDKTVNLLTPPSNLRMRDEERLAHLTYNLL